MDEKEIQKNIDWLTGLIDDPKTSKETRADAYNNRGNSYADLGKTNKALADYNKAIEINKEFAEAYNGRGNLYSYLEQTEKALADYNKAIKINPNDADYYNNRGNLYSVLGQTEEALADYNKAIYISPYHINAYNNRGIFYANLGEVDNALADYMQAIKYLPKFPEAYYNRGGLYARQGQYNEAKQDYLSLINYTKTPPRPLSASTLYKCEAINSYKLKSLIKSQLYFAKLDQLNDPLECFLYHSDDNALMKETLDHANISPRILSLFDFEERFEANNLEGIELLFSHYADSHRGICIGYEFDFKKLQHKKRLAYGDVNYKKQHNLKNLEDLFMLKSPAWRYENEFRLVRFDEESFLDAKIKSITFGFKCPHKHKQLIYTALTKKYSDIKFYQMQRDEKGSNILERALIQQNELNQLAVSDERLQELLIDVS